MTETPESWAASFIWYMISSLYSMKIKEQTRKLAAGCSKHSFEVADKTDVV
ncbi:N-ethylammeline chlorohydrolase [Streptococcus mitis]|uniref:N-ethylammeline chlorohydrolase n=1 Tax=Streptococcus mitis TaxID=28037 RepID=A0A139PSV0_STRMT|nr:N-ethylammeline chlorohydrolase [Streptococcus mitis]